MEVKKYTIRVDEIDLQRKIDQLSSSLKIAKNAVIKRATVIGVDIISNKYFEKKQDKTADETITEILETLSEGFKLLLRNQDRMRFDISILQSAIYSLLNVKAMELENGNGEISAEDLVDGIYDEPPKWIDELIKTE